MAAIQMTRTALLAHRVRAQQLDARHGDLDSTRVLDLGVQDTGVDGARWALANRGVDVTALDPGELVVLWTLRGAPHAYRRADVAQVAAAVAPFSEADAGKRIYDAAKPLREAGIPILEALDAVAAAYRTVVTGPTGKGEASAALAAMLPQPYLRWCRPCQATHLNEMPFRLAAVRAGLELEPGTSPPVLVPIPRFSPVSDVPPRFDVVRGYLRGYVAATPQQVSAFLDAPLADIKQRWPSDAVEVAVEGDPGPARRSTLAAAVQPDGEPPDVVRLLGPFDPYLQTRDRSLLVAHEERAKQLWPVLGRPGAVLAGVEIVGTWRPRASAGSLRLEISIWEPLSAAQRAAIDEQAERLAAVREVRLVRVSVGG